MRKPPRMTAGHFEFIADVIAELTWDNATYYPELSPSQRLRIAQFFARALSDTNPSFNREKFITRATPERAR